MKQVVIKILQGSIVTETMLHKLTTNLLVRNFLSSICQK